MRNVQTIWVSAVLGVLLAGCVPTPTQSNIGYPEAAQAFRLVVGGQSIAAQGEVYFYRTQDYDIALRLAQRFVNVSIVNKSSKPLGVVWVQEQ
jgi:hypothetical protein